MVWEYVTNIEQAGCKGCGRTMREGIWIFEDFDSETGGRYILCPPCVAEYLAVSLPLDLIKEIFRELREGLKP